eukprot:436632_1
MALIAQLQTRNIKNPYVIIIGIEIYKNKRECEILKAIPYDVQQMKNLWKDVYKFKYISCLTTDSYPKSTIITSTILTKYLNIQVANIENDDSIDGLILIYSGHGGRKNNTDYIICGNYEPKPIKWLQDKFKNDNCANLEGKPKLFYLDCCRGRMKVQMIKTISGQTKAPTGSDNTNTGKEVYINEIADYFVHYSTCPKYEALSDTIANKRFASYLVVAIYKVFYRAYMSKSVILSKVTMEINNVVNKMSKGQQTPSTTNRLSYEICIIPHKSSAHQYSNQYQQINQNGNNIQCISTYNINVQNNRISMNEDAKYNDSIQESKCNENMSIKGNYLFDYLQNITLDGTNAAKEYIHSFKRCKYNSLTNIIAISDEELMKIGIKNKHHRIQIRKHGKRFCDTRKFLSDNKLSLHLLEPLIVQNIGVSQLTNLSSHDIDKICDKNGIKIGDKVNLKTVLTHYQVKVDHKIKIILIGDPGVGKTCLVIKYVHKEYGNRNSTIGIDQYDKRIKLKNKTEKLTVQLNIWDTAGQERYQTGLSKSYYHDADAIILCYAVDSKESFRRANTEWSRHIEENAKDDVIISLAGCKSDRSNYYREISIEQGMKMRMKPQWKKYIRQWHECSAATGQNVKDIFIGAARMVIDQRKRQRKKLRKLEARTRRSNLKTLPIYHAFLPQNTTNIHRRRLPAQVAIDLRRSQRRGRNEGCFSSESTVLVYPHYERRKIDEVKIYDKILTYDSFKEQYFWDKILVQFHFEQNEVLNNKLVSMVQFQLENNLSLTMTRNHLCYVNNVLTRADEIKMGDKLKHFADGETKVISIEQNVMKYPRNLLTYNGNVVINGFAASSFTETLIGENVQFGKSLRYLMSNYYDNDLFRHCFYFGAKVWREHVSFDFKQYIGKFRVD